MEIKTTDEISFTQPSKKQWVSLDSLKKAIDVLPSYGHAEGELAYEYEDDNLICVGELLEQLKENEEHNKFTKCSYSECKNKANFNIGHGLSKGSIPICKECYELYRQHIKARKELNLEVE